MAATFKKVIKYPVITEKTSQMQSIANQYVFAVDAQASKEEIRREVEGLKKNIEVEEIRTLIVRGKVKRFGRSIGKRPNIKKAIVRLKAGQSLELFEAAV